MASISAAELEELVAEQEFLAPKTHNNALMVLKCTFAHATKTKPALISRSDNPADALGYLKLHQQVNPRMVYDITTAEFLIRELRKDWGEGWGNYFEFAFFGSGMRPSEEVALEWPDFDESSGQILVERARVMGKAKGKTKNGLKRWVKLSPRALEILKRQRQITGALNHRRIFVHADGAPIHDRESPWKRWHQTHERLTSTNPAFHYRPPYAARHSSVTWHLMCGKSDRWIARQHGHSVLVLHKVYAHWLSEDDDGEPYGPKALEIRKAFGYPLPMFQKNLAAIWQQPARRKRSVGSKTWRRVRDSNPRALAG